MLKDDIELLSGRIIEGSLTPALFLLLKDTQDMDTLCKDLNVVRSSDYDSTRRSSPKQGYDTAGGFSLEEWLANNAQPVSL